MATNGATSNLWRRANSLSSASSSGRGTHIERIAGVHKLLSPAPPPLLLSSLLAPRTSAIASTCSAWCGLSSSSGAKYWFDQMRHTRDGGHERRLARHKSAKAL